MIFRIAILVALFGLVYVSGVGGEAEEVDTEEIASSPWVVAKLEPESPFPLQAKAGIVLDRETGEVFYERNRDMVLPIASLTKIMTAMVVLDEGSFDMNLLKRMLVFSDNDAAERLIKGDVLKMNQKAQELGMQNTNFDDASGLSPLNVSSVEDLIILTKASLNYSEIWEVLKLPSYLNIDNTNELLGEYGVIAGKTGYTSEAGESLLLLTDNLITIVLNADDRFLESQKLIELFNVERSN